MKCDQFFKKTLLRPKHFLELGSLYFLCFSLLTLLLYVQKRAYDSYVLMRYTKFLIEHSFIIGVVFSLVVMMFHYRILTKAKTEIKCRILVGDRTTMLRLRYGLVSLSLLGVILIFSCGINAELGFDYSNILRLAPILASYTLLGASMVR